MMDSPCHFCTERYPACHDKCARYISYKEQVDMERKQRQDNRITTGKRSKRRGIRYV